MQVFVYTAKDNLGKMVKAEVEAVSINEAAKLLSSKELFPLSILPKNKAGFDIQDWLDKVRPIASKDKVVFTRQLATLVKAGLPLAKALRTVQGQISNPNMLKVVRYLSNNVEGGSTLSQSMAHYPDAFNQIYISMIEVGEASGNLDDVLLRLANQEEKTQTINKKIRAAFTYPLVVLAVLLVVMVMMVTLVLPQVGKMYDDLKQPLPFLTQILLGLAAIFRKFWYLFGLAAIAAGYGLRNYLLTPSGRKAWDNLKLNMPGFNVLLRKMYMARLSRTLGSLVGSGVPMLQALEISAKSMNNVHLEGAVMEVMRKVKAGADLSKPMQDNPMFLPLMGQMLAVGEQTGTIGDSLDKVASYYEEEVDDGIRNISQMIEPATMVILGGMVAFLIASVLMPIYGLISNIH